MYVYLPQTRTVLTWAEAGALMNSTEIHLDMTHRFAN